MDASAKMVVIPIGAQVVRAKNGGRTARFGFVGVLFQRDERRDGQVCRLPMRRQRIGFIQRVGVRFRFSINSAVAMRVIFTGCIIRTFWQGLLFQMLLVNFGRRGLNMVVMDRLRVTLRRLSRRGNTRRFVLSGIKNIGHRQARLASFNDRTG